MVGHAQSDIGLFRGAVRGLGVDFGLQFSVRYRAERHNIDELPRGPCFESGLSAAGAPLTLAAAGKPRRAFSVVPADGLQRRFRAWPDRRASAC